MIAMTKKSLGDSQLFVEDCINIPPHSFLIQESKYVFVFIVLCSCANGNYNVALTTVIGNIYSRLPNTPKGGVICTR